MTYRLIDKRHNSPDKLKALCDEEAASLSPRDRAIYRKSVAAGNSPQFALGLATRRAAITKGGDRAFTRLSRYNMDNMRPDNRNAIIQIARRAGISTDGKYYHPQLGRYNDPHAWVSTAQDVLDVCKKKNLNATGYVNHVATKPDKPPERKPLAEHLIRECTQKILRNEPETRAKLKEGRLKPQELRERVIEKHGRKRKAP